MPPIGLPKTRALQQKARVLAFRLPWRGASNGPGEGQSRCRPRQPAQKPTTAQREAFPPALIQSLAFFQGQSAMAKALYDMDPVGSVSATQ